MAVDKETAPDLRFGGLTFEEKKMSDKTTSAPECQHERTVTETRSHEQARWVLPSDENYDENDPQETVTITDHIYKCADCGEVLDVDFGD